MQLWVVLVESVHVRNARLCDQPNGKASSSSIAFPFIVTFEEMVFSHTLVEIPLCTLPLKPRLYFGIVGDAKMFMNVLLPHIY